MLKAVDLIAAKGGLRWRASRQCRCMPITPAALACSRQPAATAYLAAEGGYYLRRLGGCTITIAVGSSEMQQRRIIKCMYQY